MRGLRRVRVPTRKRGEKVPAPNFPEKTALGIEVGGTCSIPIEPNQDWSVSIDQNEAGEWFWIDDDGMTAYTVRGKAGKHEVVIRVSDKEENDTDRSIDVSMTMGGQTQVIATVTRGKVERTFDLYLGKKNESGDFTPDSDGKFAYEETAADAATAVIDLKWPAEGQSGLRYPVRIAANFQWRLDSKPAWVSELSPSEGKAGETVDILLTGDPTAYPLDNEEGELVFCDYNNTAEKYTYKMSIPGCRDKGFGRHRQGHGLYLQRRRRVRQSGLRHDDLDLHGSRVRRRGSRNPVRGRHPQRQQRSTSWRSPNSLRAAACTCTAPATG